MHSAFNLVQFWFWIYRPKFPLLFLSYDLFENGLNVHMVLGLAAHLENTKGSLLGPTLAQTALSQKARRDKSDFIDVGPFWVPILCYKRDHVGPSLDPISSIATGPSRYI